jgi:hypothetical protein
MPLSARGVTPRATARRHSAPACGPEPPPVATAVRDRRAGPAHPPPHGIASSVAPRRSPGGDEGRGSRAWIRGSPRAARSTAGVAWDRVAVSVAGADRPCHLRRTSAAGRGPPRRRDAPPTGPITSPSLRHSAGIFRHNVAHAAPSPTLNGGQGPDGVPTAAAEHYRVDTYLFSVRPRAATRGPRAGLGLLRVRRVWLTTHGELGLFALGRRRGSLRIGEGSRGDSNSLRHAQVSFVSRSRDSALAILFHRAVIPTRPRRA